MVRLNIKSIIRQTSENSSFNGDGDSPDNPDKHLNHDKKCKCVRFVPTPHYQVYERTKDQTEVRDIWLATPSRRLTVVREKGRKGCSSSLLFHPSNILILIVCIGIIAVIFMTKKKKKTTNPLDILMAFV